MAYKFTKQDLKLIEKSYSYAGDPVAAFIKDAKEYLKAVEDGRALFNVEHVSNSGMSRVISVKACMRPSHAGNRWWYRNFISFFEAMGDKYDDKHGGIKSTGCGMDMVFALNYYAVMHLKGCGIISRKRADKLAQLING